MLGPLLGMKEGDKVLGSMLGASGRVSSSVRSIDTVPNTPISKVC